MASEQTLFKPSSDSNGNATILIPSSLSGQGATVDIIDQKGNVISSGVNSGLSNGDRDTFRFPVPGNQFSPGDVQFRINDSQGNELFTGNVGQGDTRYVAEGANFQGFSADPNGAGNIRGGSGGDGSGGVQFGNVGGQDFVLPSFVDFSQIGAPSVDFNSAFSFAQNVGRENRETLFRNINDPRTRQTALNLIDTDLLGILRGIDVLGPRVRAEGDLDTATNINRAGIIDRFNLSRIPGFNEFNREEVSRANEFIRDQREQSIEASGLNFRNRITKILDQLDTQSEGRLSDPLLDTLITTTNRDEGADIASASGISSRSGAGVAIQDRLDIDDRIALALDAQKTLPGVLTNAQAVLQPPEQTPPTLFAEPTGVPLNVSNIADRIPVQANLSAGQTQLAIGDRATNLEVIPATTALSSNLATQQFNETAQFERDKFVLGAQQGQLTATDTAVQGGLNAVKADQIREQQFAAFNQGLGIRQESETTSAIAQGLGTLGSFIGSTVLGGAATGAQNGVGIGGGIGGGIPGSGVPNGSNSIVSGILNGLAGNIIDLATEGVGAVTTNANDLNDVIFENGNPIEVGQNSIEPGAFQNFVDSVNEFFSGNSAENPAVAPEPQITQRGGETFVADAPVPVEESNGLTGIFDTVSQAASDVGVDGRVVANAGNLLLNWGNLDSGGQVNSSGQIAVDVLQNSGIIDSETAGNLRSTTAAIGTLASPTATESERVGALAAAGASFATTSFTGPVNDPTSIGGTRVIGSYTNAEGTQFQLADGRYVPQSELVATANTANALQAFSILTSNASTDDKLLALSSVGVQGAAANQLVSQVSAGNTLAGLSLFNTARNWQNMNNVERAVSAIQTSNIVFSAAAQNTGQQAASSGASALSFFGPSGSSAAATEGATAASGISAGSVLGGTAGVASVGLGINQAADTIAAADDLPQSQSVKTSTTGLAGAGAAIGGGAVATGIATGAIAGSYALPIVGTAIGAAVGAAAGFAVGSTGTGKNSGQILRDGWRGGLVEAGLADKRNGSQYVTLADGSQYDIGQDGNAKLDNVGGGQRNTFDIDWGNKVAVESIPSGHLFAIASGLDPTNTNKFDLFHRATAQGINAATSNASSVSEANANFRAMMRDKVDPRELALRVEMLRVGESITDQEYNVYLNQINNMFDTQITPTDRGKARQGLINMLSGRGELSKQDQKYLELITSPKELTDARERLRKRIEKDNAAR